MIKFDTTNHTQSIIEKRKISAKKVAISYYVALRDIGNKNVKDIKNNIKTTGGEGITYKKRIRGNFIIKQASNQSQYPISWTGTLKAGNRSSVNSPTKLVIFNNVKYAYHVENKSPSKGGRPFMIKTIKRNNTETKKILVRKIDECLARL